MWRSAPVWLAPPVRWPLRPTRRTPPARPARTPWTERHWWSSDAGTTVGPGSGRSPFALSSSRLKLSSEDPARGLRSSLHCVRLPTGAHRTTVVAHWLGRSAHPARRPDPIANLAQLEDTDSASYRLPRPFISRPVSYHYVSCSSSHFTKVLSSLQRILRISWVTKHPFIVSFIVLGVVSHYTFAASHAPTGLVVARQPARPGPRARRSVHRLSPSPPGRQSTDRARVPGRCSESSGSRGQSSRSGRPGGIGPSPPERRRPGGCRPRTCPGGRRRSR